MSLFPRKTMSRTGSRIKLEDEDKIEIALRRFAGYSESGKPIDIATLAKQYKRDPAVISRAILSAFREGLIEIRKVSRRPQESHRVLDLAQQLLEASTQLVSAIVIDAAANEAGDDNSGIDDRVHQQLGQAMARL